MLPDEDPDKFELFEPTDGIWTNHKPYGEHITVGAKQLKDQLSRGSRSRKPRFVRDHWWDSTAMMLVAQSIEQWFRANLVPKRINRGRSVRARDPQEIGAR